MKNLLIILLLISLTIVGYFYIKERDNNLAANSHSTDTQLPLQNKKPEASTLDSNSPKQDTVMNSA